MVQAQDLESGAVTTAPVTSDNGSSGTQLQTQAFTEEDKPIRNRYSPWSVSYFNWSTQNMEKTREGKGRLTSYNYLGLEYRLSYGSKLSLRPTFFINGAGEDFIDKRRDSEFSMGDIYLQYYRYNLGLLPGNIGVSGALRLYVPVSDMSRDQTLITRIQGKLLFVKPVAYGVQLNYVFEPKYYFYRDRAYLMVDGDYEAVRGNKWGSLLHYVELAERIGSNWGLAQSVGFDHDAYYDVPASGIRSRFNDRFQTMLSAFIDLGSVNFKVGLNNSIDVRRPRQSFRLFREDETEYSLMTYAHF